MSICTRRRKAAQHSNGADAPDGLCDHGAAARGSLEPLGGCNRMPRICLKCVNPSQSLLSPQLWPSGCTRFLCIACDGYLGATGQVYEWVDAPSGAKSLAFVDTATLGDHRVSPLVGAEITLEPWTPWSQQPAGDATATARKQTFTDKDGHFRVGARSGLGISKPRCQCGPRGFRESKKCSVTIAKAAIQSACYVDNMDGVVERAAAAGAVDSGRSRTSSMATAPR
jgi:hypothetical protein